MVVRRPAPVCAPLVDRFLLVLLLGFSTQIWWVTTRGGVWHTGHLIATILTLCCLIELWGARRAWLVGLLAGAAFLTRAPLAFAIPFYALLLAGDAIWEPRRWPWRAWIGLALGVLPSLAFFFWYNAARFGSPLESGYGLALLPDWLEAQRRHGLFSTFHIPMNVDYLFLHLPGFRPTFPFLFPDGLGMSIFLTSPGLLYAIRAPWRSSRAWWLALAALFVLIPTLLYYGGGWLQYGYRYALDSITFVWALCAVAAAHVGRGRESVGYEGTGDRLGLAAADPVRRRRSAPAACTGRTTWARRQRRWPSADLVQDEDLPARGVLAVAGEVDPRPFLVVEHDRAVGARHRVDQVVARGRVAGSASGGPPTRRGGAPASPPRPRRGSR